MADRPLCGGRGKCSIDGGCQCHQSQFYGPRIHVSCDAGCRIEGICECQDEWAGANCDVPRRIIAIGDVHASPDKASEVFKMAGVMDMDGNWAGGDYTWLVLVGDLVGRGCNSIGMLDVVMHLNDTAVAAGGKIIVLTGNHELMNLNTIYSYVTAQDLEFTDGAEGREAAFSAASKYGRYLRDVLQSYWIWNRVLFVHGGIDIGWARNGLGRVDDMLRKTLSVAEGSVDHYYEDDLNQFDSPMWNRKLLLNTEEESCKLWDEIKTFMNITHIVMGHTISDNQKLWVRCGGAVLGLDVALYLGGQAASIWQAGNSDVTAIYKNERKVVSSTVDVSSDAELKNSKWKDLYITSNYVPKSGL